ncbi:hypothetical protein [Helicobacter sp. T3_23-1059]
MDYESECIIFEAKSKLKWWCYILLYVALIVCCYMICIALLDFINNALSSGLLIFMLIFFLIPLGVAILYNLFYCSKNRLYITEQGIGFEARHCFRMQKKFFRFGEVGLHNSTIMATFAPLHKFYRFAVFPLGYAKSSLVNLSPLVKSKNIHLVFIVAWDAYISDKFYDKITEQNYLKEFLITKTKESLIAKGIDIDSLPYNLENQFRFI